MARSNGRSIATKVSIEGEKQYKSAVTSINTALKTLKTEMTAVTAVFQTNANSEAALSAKMGVLTQTLAKQKEKIDVLNNAIKAGKKAQDEWKSAIEKTKSQLEDNNKKLAATDEKTRESGKQWLTYKTQVDAAKSELKSLENSSEDTADAQEKLKTKIADLEGKMKDLDSSTNGAASETGKLLESQEEITRTLTTQEGKLQGVTNKTEKWQQQLNTARAEEANLKVEIDKTNGYLSEAKNASDRCATSIDKMGKEVKEAAEDMEDGAESTERVSESFDALSSILVTSGVVNGIKKVKDALEECVDVSADFHYTMATVQAVSGATTDEMGKLETQAKDYASTTVFMAQDVANAYQVMGQAGWTVDEMLDSMKGTMSLASAASEDLGDTTNIVVDAMTAFGYSADQAGHFADVLARASADTNTSVALLGNSFQACATTAGGMGYSIDDVAVALGIMANNGLKAEMSGTALTTALTRMSGANETAAGAMEELGLTMYETGTGRAKPLSQFLGELRDSFAGMTEEQKINNAYMLAGQRGMKGLLAIVNASDDDWNNLTESIANCSGAAEEMSNIQLDTYTGQVKLLQSATEGLEIAVGDKLTPALGELAEGFTGVLTGLTGFVENNEAAVPVITGVVAALATFTAGITVATTAVKVFQLVTSTLAGALNPVALALGGISIAAGLLATDFTALEGAEEDFRGKHEATMASFDAEAENVAVLAARLDELTSKSSLNAAEQAEVEAIVGSLNGSIPDLGLEYDKLTGSVNLTTDAIISAAKAMANQEKITEDYELLNTLTDKLTESQNTLSESEVSLADAQTAYDEALQEYNEHLGEAPGVVSEYKDALNNAKDDLEFWEDQVKRDTDAASGYQTEIDNTTAEIQELSSATTTASEETENFTEFTEAAGDALEAETEEMQEANEALADVYAKAREATESGGDLRDVYNELESEFEKYKDTASEAAVKTAEIQLAALNLRATNEELITQYPGLVAGVESLGVPLESLSQWLIDSEISAEEWGEGVNSVKDSIINGFEKLKTDAEISLSDMAANLEYNVQAYQSWDQNLEDLMAQAVAANDQGAIDLVNTMRDLGVGYAAQVQAMKDDTTGIFWEMADNMEEAGKAGATGYYHGVEDSKQNASGIWQEISTEGTEDAQTGDYEGAGAANAEDYAGGVEGQQGTVETAAEAVSEAGANAAEGENSKYKTAGVKAITQLKIGMLSQKNSVSIAVKTIAEGAASQFNTVSWYSLGYNIASGVARGINANSYLIKNAATNAANAAYNSAKKKLGIHSPSRVMAQIGKYYDEGFAQGITENISEVTKAANRMARESATGVYQAGGRQEMAKTAKTDNGAGSERLEQLLEQYLPEILRKMENESGITAKGLAKAISPYIDSDLGKTERRKSRGN
nr:MAG TPA: minor tail protein [Caudoviricetes sp.]